jgi:hypothetical protein
METKGGELEVGLRIIRRVPVMEVMERRRIRVLDPVRHLPIGFHNGLTARIKSDKA